jgi:rhodanese-related sulfurtransferase/TusA-related sulfurtransferase
MSNVIHASPAAVVDARGLSCPMPIVKARKAIDSLQVGDVMEVLTTDKGSPSDFRNWCRQTDQKFLGMAEENGFFRLLVKKVVTETREKGRTHPLELSNPELESRLASGHPLTVLDVREEQEYGAGHIPGAIHVPIERIEEGVPGLDPAGEIAVVCRSGRRSDYACQILAHAGYSRVYNVVPGMSEWKGSLEGR